MATLPLSEDLWIGHDIANFERLFKVKPTILRVSPTDYAKLRKMFGSHVIKTGHPYKGLTIYLDKDSTMSYYTDVKPFPPLSEKEIAVLIRLKSGMDILQVAGDLGYDERYLRQMMKVLGVRVVSERERKAELSLPARIMRLHKLAPHLKASQIAYAIGVSSVTVRKYIKFEDNDDDAGND